MREIPRTHRLPIVGGFFANLWVRNEQWRNDITLGLLRWKVVRDRVANMNDEQWGYWLDSLPMDEFILLMIQRPDDDREVEDEEFGDEL